MSIHALQQLEQCGTLPSTAVKLEGFWVAALPNRGPLALALAIDGRRAGEETGKGSGTPVWFDGAVWRTFYDNSQVSS